MDKSYEFDLIGNARESMEHAIGHLTRTKPPSSNDLKRAILDVSHVIELVLKEKIQSIHPSLIWEKIDEYPNEDKRTIGTELAIQRLKTICNIKFEKKTLDGIKFARRIRNRIEHYKFSVNERETRSIICAMLSAIFDFSKSYLSIDWVEEFKNKPEWKILIKDMHFQHQHGSIIEKRMKNKKINVFVCHLCGRSTFDLKLEKCELCGHRERVLCCDECNRLFPKNYMNVVQPGDEYFDSMIRDGPEEELLICNGCFYPRFNEDDN